MDSIYELPVVSKQTEEEEDCVRYHTRSTYSNLPAPQNSGSSLKKDHVSARKHTGATSSRRYKRETDQAAKKKQPTNWKWIAAAATSILVLVIVVVVVIVIAVKVYQPPASSRTETPKSCLDLREDGHTESGFYVIQPDERESDFTAYCDMETSGGGWTLISSIHENDISGKCTTADVWFSNDNQDTSVLDSRNWENKNTFGNVKKATIGDYKNSGYHNIKASDIMMRHVPKTTELCMSKQDALLEYHTENGFLENHEGNLYGVYREEYNLTSIDTGEIYFSQNNKEMLDRLEANANDIISGIPDFYSYAYGSSSNSLSDGGNGMFTNSGMQVYIYPCSITLTYGSKYRCSSYTDVDVASRKTIPFFALMTIGNNNIEERRSSFYLRVRSYRPDTDLKQTYSGILTNGDFTMQYNAFCRYQSSTTIPSLCDVFYAVSNERLWKSSSLSLNLQPITSYSSYYYAYQYAEQYPQNIILGYTMLSRVNGYSFSRSYIESPLIKMLAIFTSFQSVAIVNEDLIHSHLVEPVKYTIGGESVLGTVPTSLRSDVDPGYVQFRARNNYGAALALCPAVRVNTFQVDSLCVGGVFAKGSDDEYCSDYANWNDDRSVTSIDEIVPGPLYRSRQYIESTMLIFYR